MKYDWFRANYINDLNVITLLYKAVFNCTIYIYIIQTHFTFISINKCVCLWEPTWILKELPQISQGEDKLKLVVAILNQTHLTGRSAWKFPPCDGKSSLGIKLHTRTHTHAHTYIHTYIRTHIHIDTHTHRAGGLESLTGVFVRNLSG